MFAALSGWFLANKLSLFKVVAVLALVGAIVFAIWFSMHSRQELAVQNGEMKAEIVALKGENATLAATIDAVKRQRDEQRNEFQAIIERSDRLNEDLATIREEIARRQETITKHDLGAIGAKKPGLLEPRINKATRDQFKRIEEATRP